jgi:hydrogenase maturation protease
MTSVQTLIVGIGNPLRTDDGFGWRLADRLVARGLPAGVAVYAYHQLTPELAEVLYEAAQVIFLDVDIGVPPGVVRVLPVMPAPSAEAFSHRLTPEALLVLTRELYGRAPLAHCVTVGPANLGFGTVLSAPVEAALAEAEDAVIALVHRGPAAPT